MAGGLWRVRRLRPPTFLVPRLQPANSVASSRRIEPLIPDRRPGLRCERPLRSPALRRIAQARPAAAAYCWRKEKKALAFYPPALRDGSSRMGASARSLRKSEHRRGGATEAYAERS